MEEPLDLNGLLQDILLCDSEVSTAEIRVDACRRVLATALDRRTTAQKRFDAAVLAARGMTKQPVLPAEPVAIVGVQEAEIEADETPRVKMGPLPPTSPALKPGWTGAAKSDEDVDDREDEVFDDPHAA